MKTFIKYILIGSLVLAINHVTYAQEEGEQSTRESRREQRKWEREKRRIEKQEEKEKLAELTSLMIENQRFVLEADYLSDKYGQRVSVSSNINFIIVDSSKSVIQFGSAYDVGYNGVGGATLEGRVTKYEFTRTGRDNKNYHLKMSVMLSLGTYDIFMIVSEEGFADANIRGNWSGQLNYHGSLVPLSLSRVYQGFSIY